jgi:hypothetical protein
MQHRKIIFFQTKKRAILQPGQIIGDSPNLHIAPPQLYALK